MVGPIEKGSKLALKEFLKTLTVASRRYGFKIEGCGCCMSPFLVEMMPEDEEKLYSVYHSLGYLALRTKEDIDQQEWWKEEIDRDEQ